MKILTPAETRITTKQAMEHPWLEDIDKLKEYNGRNKKQRILLWFITIMSLFFNIIAFNIFQSLWLSKILFFIPIFKYYYYHKLIVIFLIFLARLL